MRIGTTWQVRVVNPSLNMRKALAKVPMTV